MHCYIDRYYQQWQQQKAPPTQIPLPPKVHASGQGEVRLVVFFGRKQEALNVSSDNSIYLNEEFEYTFFL